MIIKHFLFVVLLLFPSFCFSKKINEDPNHHFSFIRKAIKENNLSSLKKLLSLKKINFQDSQGYSSLHIAVIKNRKNMVDWILKNKADVNIKTKNGKTPLHIACSKGNVPISQTLIQEYKANTNIADNKNRSPLHHLLQRNYLRPTSKDEKKRLKIAHLLLKHKANINTQDTFLETPLHIASHNGYFEMASLLLKNKANVNVRNKHRQTPLHQAVTGAAYFKRRNMKLTHDRVVDVLLKKNPKINIQDEITYSPLHYASEHGLVEITKKILIKKPNVDLQTKEGWTALHMAAGKGHLPIVDLLIKNNAKVNIKDNTGAPPLYFAVGYGDKKIVSRLLKSNAISIVDDKIIGAGLLGKEKEEQLKKLLKKFKIQQNPDSSKKNQKI